MKLKRENLNSELSDEVPIVAKFYMTVKAVSITLVLYTSKNNKQEDFYCRQFLWLLWFN